MSAATLQNNQLQEVLSQPLSERGNLVIGGFISESDQTLTLVRADYRAVTVPLSTFKPSGTTAPDFTRFEIIDYGHGLRFGEYESAVDAVLQRLQ